MRHLRLVLTFLALALAATACLPANPGPTGLYLGKQSNIHPVVSPKDRPITWGSAPPIDEDYGGIIYPRTSIEQQDPRPPALPNGNQPLRAWAADPNNGVEDRPAIIWVHGGGFAVGLDSMHALANGTAKEYAQRGYVGFSVEYRIDTTLFGDPGADGRPPSLCQWVQDNEDPGDPTWEANRAQCMRNIVTAQRDIQGFVRWLRAHAAQFDVDPDKIAVGGFSAGAVTAHNMAYRSEDVGPVRYFTGDDRSVARSRVQAALSASGCLYPEDDGPLTRIGPGDAPTSSIASELDQAVPYECVAATTRTARGDGLTAELTSYCDDGAHAAGLYREHKAATDEQWTTFLARELKLYSGMRPPSAAPLCR